MPDFDTVFNNPRYYNNRAKVNASKENTLESSKSREQNVAFRTLEELDEVEQKYKQAQSRNPKILFQADPSSTLNRKKKKVTLINPKFGPPGNSSMLGLEKNELHKALRNTADEFDNKFQTLH